MAVTPEVEAYLAALPPERRARLESMRAVVLAEAPTAEERIAYGIPTYRLDGRMLVSIASFAKHDSLFPASREVRDRLGPRIEPFVHGRGTFRFQVRHPLPLDLIRQIVHARVEETTADPRQ
jgi:uncharacterized protein YdhG (YjbR/CyaY superfamily)